MLCHNESDEFKTSIRDMRDIRKYDTINTFYSHNLHPRYIPDKYDTYDRDLTESNKEDHQSTCKTALHRKSNSESHCMTIVTENKLLKRTLNKYNWDNFQYNNKKCYDTGGFNIPLFLNLINKN